MTASATRGGFPVRAALLVLTALSVAATAFELATLRHWNGVEQLIPWAALAVLAVATATFAVTPALVGVVRVAALVVLAASLYGVVDHTLVNLRSGPLDGTIGPGWDALPALQQWWYAATMTVGPSPTLAPGVLGQAALLLVLATLTPPRREVAASRSPSRRHADSS